MRNVLLAAALVLVAAEARADIAVLTNGMTLKICLLYTSDAADE